jgi:hypothetical protein
MFRRLSRTFNRKRESDKANTNGYNNGITNGTTNNGDVSDNSSDHDNSKEAQATREDVRRTFEEFAQLVHAAQRPLPNQSGDGAYLEKEEPTGCWADAKNLGLKDVRTVRHIMEDKASGKPQDDRKMHMEEIIQLVAALPTGSFNRLQLTTMFLDELWNSLQHPPLSYLGDKYLYRSPDGSNNSYIFPNLGKANTPYARSIPRQFLEIKC